MARRTSRFILISVLILCSTPLRGLGAQGIRLALPADCPVEVRWVCPPLDSDRLREAQWLGSWAGASQHEFDVDASGQPWFTVRRTEKTPQQILNPIRQYRFALSHPFKGMVCLDSGALLFYTDHDLGFISPIDSPPTNEDLPILPFQPVVAMPLQNCRVYSGADDALYVVGESDSGNHEVYLLQPEATTPSGPKTIRSFRKIFTTSAKKIEAVTGDGQTTFVSLGRTIARITSEAQIQPDIFVHPTDTIEHLAYSPNAGLFYATAWAVGLAGENGAWDLLPLSYAKIALRGDSLYVCLSDTLGVFALDRIAELGKYAKDAPYTAYTSETPAIEVTSLKFRAFLIDPNGKAVESDEFARSDIKRVQGLAGLHPLGKHTARTALTIQWSGPTDLREDGYRTYRRIWHGTLDFTDGLDQRWFFEAPYEETFYPGQYTLRILSNGTELGTGTFTITGQTTLLEAAMQDNVPLMKTLLEQGADVDQRDSEGQTALYTAAFHGSVEAAKLLLEHGADVNARDDSGQTPLFHLVLGYDGNPAGALATGKLLIEHGLDLSVKTKNGQGLFDSICYGGDTGIADLVDLFLAHGVDANVRDDKGQTPLARLRYGHSSAPVESVKIARRLIRHGADITAVDNDGGSVFNHLAGSDNAELVELLLAHGADPGKPDVEADGDKSFPLLEVDPRNHRILELLLSHGANPNVEDFPGYTALSRAIDDAEPEAVRILLAHGASVMADCKVRYRNGSPLRGALACYLEYAPKDRVKAQRSKDIFFMLRSRGAQLRPAEELIVGDKRLHGWLPPQFVLDILQRNDQAVLDARDLSDPMLQQAVVSRLLDMARAKTAEATANQGYQAALALCDQAKTRAQVWRIESQCPLIYYNMGLLYGQIGQIEAAKDNFRRYLDLAPNAQDAEAIRKSVGL